eukprot:SAG31_NODE_7749_length_1605_cov_1.111554_1_plen_133_part_10
MGAGTGAWDPSTVESDARHLFPIITPGVGKARLNSTHNVTPATFRILKRELERGYALTNKLWQLAFAPAGAKVLGKGASAPDSKAEDLFVTAATNCWRTLLQGSDFFERYDSYVGLSIGCNAESTRCNSAGAR